MDADERTRDIYEKVPGYPELPLVPLPEPGASGYLEELGLRPSRLSHWIVKAAMFATGFSDFQKQLPNSIEGLLRRCDLRGSYLFAPVVSATLALEDDPRGLSPIERAATMLFAARSLYDDIVSGNLAPDQHQGQVLEMGQYPNLFSTSLIVDDNRPRIFKSTNASHITVAVARRFYTLRIWNPGSGTTTEQLKEALVELARTAQLNRLRNDEFSPGILTCADHATQIKAFQELRKIRINCESLSAIRHSFLTLCLDLDSSPSSHAEAALLAHSGNCGNRWFSSSLQLVVFGNAKACAICNFSTYLDGNTMMRAASEIQKRAAECALEGEANGESVSLPLATELDWNVSGKLVQRAQQDLRLVQDNQQATFEIQGIGRNYFAAHNLDPVPTFILALQSATKRLTGKMVRITQFLTMSKYRCMDLVTANVTTPEVMQFVNYVDSGDLQCDRATALLREAVNSQTEACRQARRHLPFDDILGLFISSREGARGLYVQSILILTGLLLRLLGHFDPTKQREVIVSHPEVYSEIPVVGRPGIRLPYVKYFGLHYQILEEKIVVTVMPSVSWTIPNAELIAELRGSLQRIQSYLESDQSGEASPLQIVRKAQDKKEESITHKHGRVA